MSRIAQYQLLSSESKAFKKRLDLKVASSLTASGLAFEFPNARRDLLPAHNEAPSSLAVSFGDLDAFLSLGKIDDIPSLCAFAVNSFQLIDTSNPETAEPVHFDQEILRKFPSQFNGRGEYQHPSEESLKDVKLAIHQALTAGTAVFHVKEIAKAERRPTPRHFAIGLYGLQRLVSPPKDIPGKSTPYAVVFDGSRTAGRQPWDQMRRHKKKTPPETADHSHILDVIIGAFEAVAEECSATKGNTRVSFVRTTMPVPVQAVPETAYLHSCLNASCASVMRTSILALCDSQASHSLYRDPDTSKTSLDEFWEASKNAFRLSTMWSLNLFDWDCSSASQLYQMKSRRMRGDGLPTQGDLLLYDQFYRALFINVYGDVEERGVTVTPCSNVGKMLSGTRNLSDSMLEEVELIYMEQDENAPVVSNTMVDATSLAQILSTPQRRFLLNQFMTTREFLFRIGIRRKLQEYLELFERHTLGRQSSSEQILIQSRAEAGALALYVGMLCVTLHLLDQSDAAVAMLDISRREKMVDDLLDLALACLRSADWVAKPTLSFVQACILLGPVMCSRGMIEDHLFLLQDAIDAGRKLEIDQIKGIASEDHHLLPWERHIRMMVWFNLVENITFYAFEFENAVSLPVLKDCFDIADIDDERIASLSHAQAVVVGDTPSGNAYTDTTFIRHRLRMFRCLRVFLEKAVLDDNLHLHQERINQHDVLSMQTELLKISLDESVWERNTRGMSSGVNLAIEKLTLFNARHAFICRYGSIYAHREYGNISFEYVCLANTDVVPSLFGREIASAMLKSLESLELEDQNRTLIPATLLFWPISYGEELDEERGVHFLKQGFMH
ncbi:hypothetical protein QFC24_006446 [Naganishia onofrii]|uniref:Uncharacterized protein n=1 Tax=Naganishia onofrii TaxID=1851511 RepID=A0ACC2X0I5_9TREE|nr:hypothetical protein QFC24_006446 [Naganishia onofrii]